MDTLLNDIDFVLAYFDLIKSESREQHAEHVKDGFFLLKIKLCGLKLSLGRCEFFFRYLGQIINAKGWKPDPWKSSAIENMPAPTNVSTLQEFLGLANYYGNFIPNMHILRGPLNKRLKKKSKWNWSSECHSAFGHFQGLWR